MNESKMHEVKSVPVEEGLLLEINSLEKDSQEVREKFTAYADMCHEEAEMIAQSAPGDRVASLRANIQAEMKIAMLYLGTTHYREYGIESLIEQLYLAEHEEVTYDLADQIQEILGTVGVE
jgi:hypothetical protein